MYTVEEAINKYGTPLYLYNRDDIEKKCDILRDCLLPGSRLFYSMKANPLIGICRFLIKKGCGIEVASKCELEAALRSGCKAEDIIFSGPGKTKDEIAFAVNAGIKSINIESLYEAQLINECAEKNEVITDIALRINPSRLNKSSKIKMSGVPSQFGIDECDITDYLFMQLNCLKNVRVIGLQIYMGTQILDSLEICNNTKDTIELALKWRKQFDFPLKYIDFGGGFGVPYFPGESPLDIHLLKQKMNELYQTYKQELKNTELIFESGRFLVAESGIYITQVLYDKISRGRRYIVCDGGSNFHASSAFLGRFVRNNFPITTIPENDKKEEMTIVGPLCTPTDVIAQNVSINQNIAIGDYVVILKSGAYGLTHSPVMFLSHEMPMEVMYCDNGYEQILRKRGSIDQFLAGQL